MGRCIHLALYGAENDWAKSVSEESSRQHMMSMRRRTLTNNTHMCHVRSIAPWRSDEVLLADLC